MNILLREKIGTINQHLILNAFNLSDLGLYRGKMGIIIYFFMYSRLFNEKIYEEFATELLMDLYGEINTHIPFFFDDGLCGIGWGIEFLVQNNYMDGETNKILSDLDQLVMQVDPVRIVGDNMDKGLLGLVYYVVTRLTSVARTRITPFDSRYLKRLYNTIVDKYKMSTQELRPIFKEFIEYYQQPYSKKMEFDILLLNHSIEIMEMNEANINTYPLGIWNGLSGGCLQKIMLNE